MSLRVKILLSVCLIIFIVLGTSTFFHIRTMQNNYLEALLCRFEALSNGIRGDIISWIGKERDPQKMIATLKGSAFQCRTIYDSNKDTSVTHVAVLDGSGTIVAHNDRESQGTPIASPTVMDALQRHEQTIVLAENVYHALIPIFAGENYIGTVDLGFPKQIVDEKVQEFLIQSAVLLAVFLIAAFFAVSLLVHWLLTKPIKHLMQLGTRIARGELVMETLSSQTNRGMISAKFSKNSDEIAALTKVFHEMIDYLYDVTDIATRIATGDLSREVQPRSDRDVLGNAFQQMSAYLTHMASIATAMASGDLRQQIDRPDERDILGTAFHNMDTLRQSIARIMEESSKLRNSSDSLSHISVQMTSDARQTSEKVQTVFSNSQQVNERMELLSVAMKAMSSSITEISKSVNEVTDGITTAVTITNDANETLSALESRSQEIGDITEVITTITQQTNLLALNATIEAARAGESGKGFTVVANEIKELSREIAESAKDITHKIDAMQSISSSVAKAIADVRHITNHVHETSQTITAAAEKQTITVEEISYSIVDASQRSHETSKTIAEVADVTHNMTERAIMVEQAAGELASLADQLQQLVGMFKI